MATQTCDTVRLLTSKRTPSPWISTNSWTPLFKCMSLWGMFHPQTNHNILSKEGISGNEFMGYKDASMHQLHAFITTKPPTAMPFSHNGLCPLKLWDTMNLFPLPHILIATENILCHAPPAMILMQCSLRTKTDPSPSNYFPYVFSHSDQKSSWYRKSVPKKVGLLLLTLKNWTR